MSRRIGQRGNVYQPAYPGKWNSEAPCYGRFWVDLPPNSGVQARKRCTVSHGVCPTKTIARQRLREYPERESINSKQAFHQNTAPAVTFRQQAEWWIATLPTRKRKPVKPATIHGFWHSLNKWILPSIGELLLVNVGNAALKAVIEKMSAAGLSPQSIVTHTRVIRMVVASAVDAEGEQLYPRKWNHDFVGLPVIDAAKQHRPTMSRAEVEAILSKLSQERYKVLVALLAGTGLRIGEALGLRNEDLSDDCRMLSVKRSIWKRREQEPKTPNAFRVVDIPEQLAQKLREYCANKSGYLFSTRRSGVLSQRNVLRALYSAGATCGFHAIRRFRTETQ